MKASRHAITLRAIARAALCAAALVATLAAAPGCFGGGDGASPTPTVTPADGAPTTRAPSPTPTRAPADRELGDRLRYEGDFEGAVAVYESIIQSGDEDEAQDARLAQAQILERQERFEEARDVLTTYLINEGAAADGAPARFLFASVLDDLGDPAGALASYEAYVAAGGEAAAYANVERAKMLARLGRIPEAEAAAEQVIVGTDLAPAAERSFMISMGRAFEDGGADPVALAWYDRAVLAGGDVATARARSGAVRRALGDAAWVQDYLTVVNEYPESGPARDVLAELDAVGVPVGAYARGHVLYRAFRNDEARAALEQAIAAGDHPAEASYYIAAIDERLENYDAAIAGYQRAHDLNPASPLADDALWWRARLLQITRRYDASRATYTQLLAEYPTSTRAPDAEFHRGMTLYRGGDAAGAAYSWAAVVANAVGEDREEEHARALFWLGRAQRESGSPDADATLQRVIDEHPGNFYALRAEVLLGDNDEDVDDPDLDDVDTDWDEIADYIEEQYGLEPDDETINVDSAMQPWDLAVTLEEGGLHAQSVQLFQSMIFDADRDVYQLFHITRRFEQEERVSLAARSASELIAALEDGGHADPPEELLRVAYPLAYRDLVEDATDEMDVSPLLLLALVRQESFYDPDAGSPAGALGLTQVIEPTGRAIATDLGVEPFTVSDLFRPRLSLRFGARYIATQLRNFDGNAYYALAAYNGGPGTSSNAIDSSGGDIDLFVEDLEFDETRLYVKLVMENYARYRHLYEDLDRPSLPE